MTKYTVYEGSDDWSALYEDGKLVRVGDHYLIDEKIREIFSIETIQSDSFLLGNQNASYEQVASSIELIEAFDAEQAEKLSQAAELRLRAQALIELATALEK